MATITMKEMHTDLKKVQKLLDQWETVTVFKHSKPIWDINVHESKPSKKKYTWKDFDMFTFPWNPKNGNNLATTYKQYIYGWKE